MLFAFEVTLATMIVPTARANAAMIAVMMTVSVVIPRSSVWASAMRCLIRATRYSSASTSCINLVPPHISDACQHFVDCRVGDERDEPEHQRDDRQRHPLARGLCRGLDLGQ